MKSNGSRMSGKICRMDRMMSIEWSGVECSVWCGVEWCGLV